MRIVQCTKFKKKKKQQVKKDSTIKLFSLHNR
jgi:hypothetical protein